jgi:hypothetical protein
MLQNNILINIKSNTHVTEQHPKQHNILTRNAPWNFTHVVIFKIMSLIIFNWCILKGISYIGRDLYLTQVDGYMLVKYRVGHDKVAHLPFCTCPCDILSGVNMYITYSDWTVSQQSCYHHPPLPPPHRWYSSIATLLISVFTLSYGPGLIFRGLLCIYPCAIYYLKVTARRWQDLAAYPELFNPQYIFTYQLHLYWTVIRIDTV